jgi:lipid-A-disaccharide synthase
MKYFLIAGDYSGDIHGSSLMHVLKKKDTKSEFIGLGGNEMCKEGMTSVISKSDFSVMGITDVVLRLSYLIRVLNHVKKALRQTSPDILILIDYSGFNLRLLKFAHDLGIPICYYIAPKLWAWNEGRIKMLRKYVNRLLVILPFEAAYFNELKVSTRYVGSPVLENIDRSNHNSLNSAIDLDIVLMPGSRISEVKTMLEILFEIVRIKPHLKFVVAGVKTIPKECYDKISLLENCEIIYSKTYELISKAQLAIVASGTATLEVALLNTPQVVIYRTNLLNYWLAKLFIKVKYISLVNLLLDRRVVDELIQDELTVSNLNLKIQEVMTNSETKKRISEGYSEIRYILGEQIASENAANEIVGMLKFKQL